MQCLIALSLRIYQGIMLNSHLNLNFKKEKAQVVVVGPYPDTIKVDLLIQFVDTMTDYLTWSLPLVFLVFPCIILYLQLMASVTQRPVASGLDLNKENVRLLTLQRENHS